MTRSAALAAVALTLAGSAALAQEAPPAGAPKEAPKPEEAKPAKPEEKGKAKEAERLPEVFVPGRAEVTGVPEVPIDAVGSRDVLGPEILRSHPAREMNDLVKLLPAVSTRPYNGGEGAAPSFSMRGLPDDGLTEYILVLVDGTPVSPLPYGWTAPSFFPLVTEKVHAVDLHRGAHAVRYSPNTVGGVMNFVTEPIPDGRLARFGLTSGANGYRSEAASFGQTLGGEGFGYLLSAVDRGGDGFRDEGDFDQQDLDFKFRVFDRRGDWVAAKVAYFRDRHQAPGGLTPAQYEADRFANARPDNRFEGWRTGADVVAHRRLSGDSWIEGFAYASETARRLYARRPHFGAVANFLDWEDESLFAAGGVRGFAKARAAGLDHEFFGGVRAHFESLPSRTIDSFPAGGGAPTRTTDSSFRVAAYSAHLDDTIRPVKNVVVTAGARVEWVPRAEGRDSVADEEIDHDFADVLPGAGASWEFAPGTALYGNYHESFRAPQVWGFDFAGNPQDLDFEKGSNGEVGVRVIRKWGLTGSLAAWWTRFDDVGVYYSGFYENLGRIDAEGTDLALRWEAGDVLERLEGLEFHGSWTHQQSTLEEGPFAGNDTPYAWHDKAVFGVRVRRSGWTFGLDGTYVGPTYSDEANTRAENATGNLGRNRSVLTWDSTLGRRFEVGETSTVALTLGVTNLLDEERYVHSRGGFFGGGRVAYGPRQAFLSAVVELCF
jgi:Fe(3+) dicitrate transport protein